MIRSYDAYDELFFSLTFYMPVPIDNPHAVKFKSLPFKGKLVTNVIVNTSGQPH